MPTPLSSHILSQFDDDLAVLRDLVLHMGGLVEDQLAAAIHVLEQGDGAAAQRVIDGDREVDRIELRADHEAARVLALRAPLGIDLRMVISLSKSVRELERAGDESKKIARACLRGIEQGWKATHLPLLPALLEMAKIARAMLHAALNALVRMDLEFVRQLESDDDRLDQLCKSVYADGRAQMRQHPERVDIMFETIFIARSLERIGDHARNLGHYLNYLVEGHDSRHPNVG